jgi:hypothetical protein
LAAAELYKTALGSVPATGFLKMGQVQERMGYASYRAAMQVESANDFRERMPKATACYERAKEFYSRLSGSEKTPCMLRCDAMIAYVGYWVASGVPENLCFSARSGVRLFVCIKFLCTHKSRWLGSSGYC